MSDGRKWWDETFGESAPDDPVRWLQSQLRDEQIKRSALEDAQDEIHRRINRARGAMKNVYLFAFVVSLVVSYALIWQVADGWKFYFGCVSAFAVLAYLGREVEREIDAI